MNEFAAEPVGYPDPRHAPAGWYFEKNAPMLLIVVHLIWTTLLFPDPSAYFHWLTELPSTLAWHWDRFAAADFTLPALTHYWLLATAFQTPALVLPVLLLRSLIRLCTAPDLLRHHFSTWLLLGYHSALAFLFWRHPVPLGTLTFAPVIGPHPWLYAGCSFLCLCILLRLIWISRTPA